MNPNTVVHVGPIPPPHGGIASIMQQLSSDLIDYDWSVHVFQTGALPGEKAVSIIYRDLRSAFRLVSFTSAVGARIVHIHTSAYYDLVRAWWHIRTLRANNKAVKIIVHLHSGRLKLFISRFGIMGRPWLRNLMNYTDAIIVVNSQDQLWLDSAIKPATPIFKINNSIKEDFFKPSSRDDARKAIGIPVNKPMALTVGSLKEVKNQEILIRALAMIGQGKCEDLPLLCVVGAGPLKRRLSSLANELGVGKQVIFVGEITPSELRNWYRAANVFVFPSKAESFGLVVLEALSCGTPVVASPVGVASHLSTYAGAIKIVGPHDLSGWAMALQECNTYEQSSLPPNFLTLNTTKELAILYAHLLGVN